MIKLLIRPASPFSRASRSANQEPWLPDTAARPAPPAEEPWEAADHPLETSISKQPLTFLKFSTQRISGE